MIYTISELVAGELESVLHVQKEACSDEKLYAPLLRDEFEEIWTGRGHVYGAWVDKELVAFRVVLYPGMRPDNLGYELGLPSHELEHVVHLEACCVHPTFQGYGLQRVLTRHVLALWREQQKDYHVLSTVSPDNQASLHNLLACGLRIEKEIQKYGGYPRYLLYRQLGKGSNN